MPLLERLRGENMPRQYTVDNIADWFLRIVDREAGDSITHLKLQKLVYYAEAWTNTILNRQLFNEDFQAWAHGPVVRSLYDRFNSFGWEALPLPENEAVEFEPEVAALLNDIWSIYGQHSAKYLEGLTHSEEPWIVTRGDLAPEERSENIIPKTSMREYYSQLLEE